MFQLLFCDFSNRLEPLMFDYDCEIIGKMSDEYFDLLDELALERSVIPLSQFVGDVVKSDANDISAEDWFALSDGIATTTQLLEIFGASPRTMKTKPLARHLRQFQKSTEIEIVREEIELLQTALLFALKQSSSAKFKLFVIGHSKIISDDKP